MNFIKRLFCVHDYWFVRYISGDEINHTGGKRSVWICESCGKVKYSKSLDWLN